MNKKVAHSILFVLDALSVLGVVWCIQYFSSVSELVVSGSDRISFEPSILYVIFLLVIPVIHGFSAIRYIEWMWGRWFIKHQGLFIGLLIGFLFLAKLSVLSSLEAGLKEQDYVLCEQTIKGRYQHDFYQKHNCSL